MALETALSAVAGWLLPRRAGGGGPLDADDGDSVQAGYAVPGAFVDDDDNVDGSRADRILGDELRDVPGYGSFTSYDNERVAYNARIAALRPTEYPQLGSSLYLDHAGTTIPSRSLVSAFSEACLGTLLGNPHSGSAGSASLAALKIVEDVRYRVLQWCNADPNDFDVVFVANATAGIKLVAEGLRGWRELAAGSGRRRCWLGYHADAHTSLVGLREEFDEAECFPSDNAVDEWLGSCKTKKEDCPDTLRLLAFPAQSNMNGRKLPLSWLYSASEAGIHTLLDAAALAPTSPLNLSELSRAADFTVLSFYKIFGLPDLGALIVKRSAGHVLASKKYFGGGTVEMVASCRESWHIRKADSIHSVLEDGTLPVHNIQMLDCAFEAHEKLFRGTEEIHKHTSWMREILCSRMSALKHWNGSPVCVIYGDFGSDSFGPAVAFNLKDSLGKWVSNFEVEKLSAVHDIQIRTGGVCNPGGIAQALDLTPWEMQANFTSGARCGGDNDVMNGKATGVIRVSLGAMSILDDVERFISFLQDGYVESRKPTPLAASTEQVTTSSDFYVESLTVYPIKSCAGWNVPTGVPWAFRAEGLAWDREWCLVHRGTQTTISQKRYPRMALIRPELDLEAGTMTIRCPDLVLPPSTCTESIRIPLSLDPSYFVASSELPSTNICGDDVPMHIYALPDVDDFVSQVVGTPCQLARFPPSATAALSRRHAKSHLKRTNLQGAAVPLLLSNESPALVISRSSLNRLNETIKCKNPPGLAVPASVFRANIVVAEICASGFEQPYIEDIFTEMEVSSPRLGGFDHSCETGALRGFKIDVLGPCRRCQMICVDQKSGEKSVSGEPFRTLAATRRKNGKVWFGMHAALSATQPEAIIRVGDRITGKTPNDS